MDCPTNKTLDVPTEPIKNSQKRLLVNACYTLINTLYIITIWLKYSLTHLQENASLNGIINFATTDVKVC